jgi:hypothetical protein
MLLRKACNRGVGGKLRERSPWPPRDDHASQQVDVDAEDE